MKLLLHLVYFISKKVPQGEKLYLILVRHLNVEEREQGLPVGSMKQIIVSK